MSAPKLRFPEFDGEWKKKPLSDAWRPKGKRNSDGLYSKEQVLSVSGEKGIVNQIEHLGRSYAGALVDNYHVVEKGDIVYTKSPLKANPFGIIKTNKGVAGIVSTLYAVYEVREQNDPEFWDRYFELDDRTNGYLMSLVHIGAKNDMKINNERVLIDPVHIPALAEQQKIAAFLGVVDAKIDALTGKRLALVRYKNGLIQKLFSQQLRFARDDGTAFPDWEEHPFEEIACRSRSFFNPQNSTDRPILIELENIGGATGEIVGHSDLEGQASLKSVFCAGDVLFGKLRPYLRKYARPNFDGVCSSEIWVMRGTRVSNAFLLYLVQTSWFNQVANISAGSKMPRSDWSIIADTSFEIPHPDEQHKIATALSAMDSKIQKVAKQVTKLRAFKKGLLQQMFV